VIRRIRLIRGYHVLFAGSIAALIALGSWWTIFFMYAVNAERTASLRDIEHSAVMAAISLGHAAGPPAVGPLPNMALEVVPLPGHKGGGIFARIGPRFTEYGVRPTREILEKIEARAGRRHLMFIGEGSLLFLLLGMCVFMLYRLMRSDAREMRRMEHFISTVTHEMKTPIAGIKSLLQTLSAGMVPKDQEKRLFAMGLRETERLDHMVEKVLISGKLRTDYYRIDMEKVPLSDLLQAFVEHRREYLAGGAGTIALEMGPDGAGISARCDRKAVSVILENLVDNALKYSAQTPEVTIRASRGDGNVVVAVEDRGIGFDPEQAEEIFKPFVRAAGPGVDSQHGTGLGLSISRSLARKMGGNLQAESAGTGRGSRFTLTLMEAGA
jgi:signal transduction histidine kinase